MYAVIKTGGKQYRVAPDDVLAVEKIAGEAGDIVEFNEVLLVSDGKETNVGAPLVEGACVAAELVDQERARKVIIFKKKRRKNHRRTKGHRQMLTRVRITEILTGGKKPSKAAKAKAEPKAEAKEAAAEKAPAGKAAEKAPAGKTAAKAPAKKTAGEKAPAKKAAPKKTAARKPAKKADDK